MKSVYEKARNVFSDEYQLDILVEEASELIRAASRLSRDYKMPGRYNKNEVMQNLVEEMADVYIAMNHLKIRYKLNTAITGVVVQKEKRLETRLEEIAKTR